MFKIKSSTIALLISALAISLSISQAGEADVINVKLTKTKVQNSYNFDVTVKHSDEGWNHYVNKWVIFDMQGNEIATRILHHPHVNEQPFTRSLFGVVINKDIKQVIIKAYDSVHKYGGKEFKLDLVK